MSNIGSMLKQEIARLAKKEIRSQTEPLKRASTQYRKLIASLRRRVTELERDVARTRQSLDAAVKSRAKEGGAKSAGTGDPETGEQARIRVPGPAAINAMRERLGLSNADFARLAGVSSQSVYNWQQGKTRPRGRQLVAIAGIRGLGKREVRARLQSLGAAGGNAGRGRARREARVEK